MPQPGTPPSRCCTSRKTGAAIKSPEVSPATQAEQALVTLKLADDAASHLVEKLCE